jgi:hypothetical protein
VSRAAPPRPAIWILGCLLPTADRDPVIGDLVEEHALRSRTESAFSASVWFWSQLVRSAPRFAWIALRRSRWPGMLGAAVAAYVLVTVIESAGEIAMSKLGIRDPQVRSLVGLSVGLAAMVVGGYVAAWIRRGAAAVLAGIVVSVVMLLMAVAPGSVPLWYLLGFLILAPAASVAGGALFGRRRT